ncbi:DUF2235 domain-containing protein (plasmid) [Photobacterium sp. GJ3]|uniref:DUF2235 domain-containing protein n=1 Tax=Photobacterium sp. GJ3 TaxID=2829502 RepID=UPI001B8A98F3|nr:DUF2235 domain-containing protein [Photobacterium sp. GJ3]QUJ70239.1 DUF2235 domain-containing protein [Photobacterium sp. GJ3]
MTKNIILLSDGTGNSAAKLNKTNVWRTYKAIDYNNQEVIQISLYDDGVGTSSFKPLKLLGGAFGYGLRRNVIDLYLFLSRNYKPGDHIYCFGFSRGAFTIRVLIGFIANRGLINFNGESPDKMRKEAIQKFSEYRKNWKNRVEGTDHTNVIQQLNPEIKIKFVGLWDTVDAYGAPIKFMKEIVNKFFHLYLPDHHLSHIVEKACHALAIDDERETFHPVLWENEVEESSKTSKNPPRIEQVWFSGMHSNVGGGYPDDDLSYVPLIWILEKAQAAGLIIDHHIFSNYLKRANPHGKMYDSRKGLGIFYRYSPRVIAERCNICGKEKPITLVDKSVIHRLSQNITGYAPIALPTSIIVDAKEVQLGDEPIYKKLEKNIDKVKKYYLTSATIFTLIFIYLTVMISYNKRWEFNFLSSYSHEILCSIKNHPIISIILLSILCFLSYLSRKQKDDILKGPMEFG